MGTKEGGKRTTVHSASMGGQVLEKADLENCVKKRGSVRENEGSELLASARRDDTQHKREREGEQQGKRKEAQQDAAGHGRILSSVR